MAKDTNELPGVSLDPVKPPTVGAHDESIKRGHELDPINVKPFVQFTVVMVLLFVAVWVTCLYLFDATAEKWNPKAPKNVRTKYEDKDVNPLATELNDRTVSERFNRLNTYSPGGKSETEKVYAPRLEAMKQLDFGGMPEYVRSSNVEEKGNNNAQHYHPEDLLPERTPLLAQGQFDAGKKTVRLPIATVIGNSAQLGLNQTIFKHSKDVKTEYDATHFTPSTVYTPRAKASAAGNDASGTQAAHDAGHGKGHGDGHDKDKH